MLLEKWHGNDDEGASEDIGSQQQRREPLQRESKGLSPLVYDGRRDDDDEREKDTVHVEKGY